MGREGDEPKLGPDDAAGEATEEGEEAVVTGFLLLLEIKDLQWIK